MTENNKIIVDFSQFPFCFRSVTIKGKFTNKLKDSNQFFEKLELLFEKSIPFFKDYTFDGIYYASQKHSHPIPTDSEQYETIKKILNILVKSFYNFDENGFEMWFNQNINEYAMWQLGVTGGIRLIGIRKSNLFCVLFIDYHHLLYPSVKYNQKNSEKYSFCPIKKSDKGDD